MSAQKGGGKKQGRKSAAEMRAELQSLQRRLEARGNLLEKYRETEKALSERDALLQHATRIARLGYWIWDEETQSSTYCSEELSRINGVPQSQYLDHLPNQEDVLQLIDPEDRERYERVTSEASDQSCAYDVEFWITNEKEERRYIRETGEPVLDLSGKAPQFVGTTQDITDQKAAFDAVLEEERRFRIMADTSPVMLWVTDKDDTPTFYNRSALDFMGFDQDVALKIGNLSGVHPDDIERLERCYAHAMEAKEPYQVEYRSLNHAGDYRSLLEVGAPLIADDGQFFGFSGSAIDITEQKQIEASLRQRERAAAVGRLAGGIAHEFNNLMMVILGWAEDLEESLAEDDTRRRGVATAKAAIGRGHQLTQDLLAYAERLPGKQERVDMATALKGLLPLIKHRANQQIQIDLSLAPKLWQCRLDRAQLDDALVHLISNALEATPLGDSIRIEARNASLQSENEELDSARGQAGYVAISVIDKGLGMTPEVANRVTDPFFTTKDVGQGVGMGLSMVYGFAKQAGGELVIESEDGKGTTATIFLPRA